MEDTISTQCEGIDSLGLKNNYDSNPKKDADVKARKKVKFTNLVNMRPVTPWQAAKLRRTIAQLAIVKPQPRSRHRSVNYQNMETEVKVIGQKVNTAESSLKCPKQCEDDTETWLNEYVVKDCRNIQGYVSTKHGHKGARIHATVNKLSKIEGYNKRNPRQKQRGSKTTVRRDLGFKTYWD